MQHLGLIEITQRDPRYAYEAYEFLFDALGHTQRLLGRAHPDDEPPPDESRPEHHVSGTELVLGACDLALREFGRMARVVFHLWGVDRTDDFGEIVFNLIDANLLSKTDRDDRADFRDVCDLDAKLRDGYTIDLPDDDV